MILPPITRGVVRRPAHSMSDGLTTQSHLGAPDLRLAQAQFDAYVEALRSGGMDVAILPPDERFPDGHFVEDVAVIFRDMVFLTRPGAASREGEGEAVARALAHLRPVNIQGDEARLEGGDVLFCADRVLIGLSTRTNRAGAEQLRAALHSVQPDLRVDFVPFDGVLHLKTGLTELAPAVFLRSPHITFDYDLGDAEVVALPPAEAYAANVLPVNDTVLVPAGYPRVAELAARHVPTVIALAMSEFAKMDGGLTCLSLRY